MQDPSSISHDVEATCQGGGMGQETSGLAGEIVFSKFTRFPQVHSTDVPPSSLCPPRRWSGAGVGVGMLT